MKKNNDILVSINCITYNHEKYIQDAIESFLMQKTNFRYEILIHDDASIDKTSDIIIRYQKKCPNMIKPILEKENQYSKGVKRIDYKFNVSRAKGKYIAMCEGDDYWIDPYKLQKQVDYMENHPYCGMCFHAADVIKVGKGRISTIRPYNKNCISPTEDIILGSGGFMATNSILYRKSIIDNAPDFYLNAPVGDYPLQIFLSTQDYAYYIDKIMSVYRVGVKGSWTNRISFAKDRDKKCIDLNKKIIYMLREFNEYSNMRYSDTVNRKILKIEFEILKIEKKIKQLKMKKYKILYDSLGVNQKIKIHANYYFPKIYSKLRNIKRHFEKIY